MHRPSRAHKLFAEFNNPRGRTIRRTKHNLERLGLGVHVLTGHKTAVLIERPYDFAWADFKKAIRSELAPRRGSVIIFSETSGRTYLCSNRGNRPGRFDPQ